MATATVHPNETVDSWCAWVVPPGASGPGLDVHEGIDEGYPPGNIGDYYACSGISHYANIKFGDVPADFDKTGPDGIRLVYYYKTTVFTNNCRVYVQGFVDDVAVTDEKWWAINSALAAVIFQFDETEITANWDGSKGYLTGAQMNDLEIRFDYQNGTPEDPPPPPWEEG
jgi:hypothetical protein